ncbi:MAG: hypothetical protein ACYC77_01240 [Coriobacteriia bacterium]
MELKGRNAVLVIASVAIAAAALGGLGIYLLTRAPETVIPPTTANSSTEATATETTSTGDVTQTASPTGSDPGESTIPTPTEPATPVSAWDSRDGRFFSKIEKLTTKGGKTYLGVDYAQLLVGDDAAAAATAAGEESPPPNDYFIINQSEKVRTWPVSPGVTVTLATWEAHFGPDPYPVSFATWRDMYTGASSAFPSAAKVWYWITLDDGVITSIDEQYFP